MKDIYTSIPINKTAALVVNQSGCTSHKGLSNEQLLANLKYRYHTIVDKCQQLKKNSEERKSYGQEMHELCLKMSVLRNKLNLKRQLPDLGHYIIKIAKSRMSKDAWSALVKEAEKEKAAAEHCGTGQTSQTTAQTCQPKAASTY
jgi:hypothetical protein